MHSNVFVTSNYTITTRTTSRGFDLGFDNMSTISIYNESAMRNLEMTLDGRPQNNVYVNQ